jgi:SAM-dependent methyltransferase
VHPEAWAWVSDAVGDPAGWDGNLYVLDLGGKPDAYGSLRSLFDFSDRVQYVCVDMQPGDGVDAVGDAAIWRPTDAQRFDVVLCTEVFEHAPYWRLIMANMAANVLPGGLVVATCAVDPREPHSCRDGWGGPLQDGEFYENPPVGDMEYVASRLFDGVRCASHPRGDWYMKAYGRGL